MYPGQIISYTLTSVFVLGILLTIFYFCALKPAIKKHKIRNMNKVNDYSEHKRLNPSIIKENYGPHDTLSDYKSRIDYGTATADVYPTYAPNNAGDTADVHSNYAPDNAGDTAFNSRANSKEKFWSPLD